jgi:ankyrin repeat protein
MGKDVGDDLTLLTSLCCAAKIFELKEKLALPQFKQLLCSPLQFGDFQNETILHYMCAYPSEELAVVQVLLEHGAVACINIGDISPLSYAARKNHKDMVRLLLKHGANPEPCIIL